MQSSDSEARKLDSGRNSCETPSGVFPGPRRRSKFECERKFNRGGLSHLMRDGERERESGLRSGTRSRSRRIEGSRQEVIMKRVFPRTRRCTSVVDCLQKPSSRRVSERMKSYCAQLRGQSPSACSSRGWPCYRPTSYVSNGNWIFDRQIFAQKSRGKRETLFNRRKHAPAGNLFHCDRNDRLIFPGAV